MTMGAIGCLGFHVNVTMADGTPRNGTTGSYETHGVENVGCGELDVAGQGQDRAGADADGAQRRARLLEATAQELGIHPRMNSRSAAQ